MISEAEFNQLTERYDLLREAFNKPSFTVKFSTGGNEGGTYVFKNGVLESYVVTGDLKGDVNENNGEIDLILKGQLSRENNLQKIFEIVKSRYDVFRGMSSRPKKVRRADSFYKAFANALAPIYSANVNEREQILPLLQEYATSETEKQVLGEEMERLKSELAPEMEIRKEKRAKIFTEVILYGVPALTGLILIIRKFRK